jgi:hypothetical protein
MASRARAAVKKIYQVLELGGTTGLVVGIDTTTAGFHAAPAYPLHQP